MNLLAVDSGYAVTGLMVALVIYGLPSIIAYARRVPSVGSVVVINVLLGWTFVGWVVALALAVRDPKPAGVSDRPVERDTIA